MQLHLDKGPAFSWPATLLLAALSVAAFAQGGFYRSGSVPVGIAVAGALVLAHRASALHLIELRDPVLATLGALGIWSVVSAAAAADPGASVPVLGLVAAMGGVLVITRRLTDVERLMLARGFVAISTLVALTGLGGVALRFEPLARSVQHLWRAEGVLTYANALGALVVTAALVAIALGARDRSPALSAATAVLLAALAASMSRGAIAAFAAGMIVLVVNLGPRRLARATIPAALGGALAFAALVPAIPERTAARPVIGLAGIALGALVAAGIARASRRTVVGAGVVSIVAACALAIVFADQVSSIAGARLTLSSVGRSSASAAAIEVALASPVFGAGPGRAALAWMQDGTFLTTRYVHNEYLQTLADLGFVGGALLLLALATGVRVLLRHRRGEVLWAGVAAALCALAVHSAMDFLWHIPVFPLLAMVLFGLVTATGKEQP